MAFVSRGGRTRNIFDPESRDPFRLSRSKIEFFMQCPRCFYLDRRLGVGQPQGPPFTLNSAVDTLLKKEFDIHRAAGTPHPLMKSYGLDMIPLAHDMINEWRENFKGVQHYHERTNFIVTGAVDDLWVNRAREVVVVDYKATSTNNEITLDSEYRQAYKRQMEIYQWLLRRNGLAVSNTGYFVYANGSKDREAFDGRLEFSIQIIPYEGNDHWVEQILVEARQCLMGALPEPAETCEYCTYRKAAAAHELPQSRSKKTRQQPML